MLWDVITWILHLPEKKKTSDYVSVGPWLQVWLSAIINDYQRWHMACRQYGRQREPQRQRPDHAVSFNHMLPEAKCATMILNLLTVQGQLM